MKSLRVLLVVGFLWTLGFTLALFLEPWSNRQQAEREGGLLPLLLGDGRRLFANHFFAKADAYFHRGVYPSIFDAPRQEEMHMVTAGQENLSGEPEDGSASDDAHGHEDEADHEAEHCDDPTHDHAEETAAAPDWIAWVNQRLKPGGHAHLEGGREREMLPWLMLATELDPSNAQAYITTAYWLRARLGRVDQAEQLLRRGLARDPRNPDPGLLYELGVLVLESRGDDEHARNLFLLTLDRWERQEAAKPEPSLLLKEAILSRLALIDERRGQWAQAVAWLEQLEPISPRPDAIRQHIEQLQSRLEEAAPPP